ncbi:MAG TPA: SDR family oxidoreductase [Chitinophagales bacterium]
MLCLILGSNSDVGQATAYKFAAQGFDILLAARNVNDYQKRLASDISIRHNVKVENVIFDGSKHSEHKGFVESLATFPDVVISVFGYLGDNEKAQIDFDEAYQILDVNLIGHVSVLNLLAEKMKFNASTSSATKGTIIGISSVAGERGRASNLIYCTAKAGFTAYLSGLRNALFAHNVHVATIIPGFIKTKMLGDLKTPAPLTAQPEEVATAVWNAYAQKQDVVYVRWMWKYVMLIIKNIPEAIFKKLKI